MNEVRAFYAAQHRERVDPRPALHGGRVLVLRDQAGRLLGCAFAGLRFMPMGLWTVELFAPCMVPDLDGFGLRRWLQLARLLTVARQLETFAVPADHALVVSGAPQHQSLAGEVARCNQALVPAWRDQVIDVGGAPRLVALHRTDHRFLVVELDVEALRPRPDVVPRATAYLR